MTENGTGHVEQPRSNETEQVADITPAISHVAMGAVDTKYFNPQERSILANDLDTFKTNADTLSYDAANAVSFDSRKKAYENNAVSFEEKNKAWNEAMWNSLQKITTEGEDMNVLAERDKALQSLGIDIEDETKENGLYKHVEGFRKKYVHEDGSNIKQFVEDIAKDCTTNDVVDMKQLQTRLDAMQPVLTVFGTENNAHMLVQDFAVAHGMLKQNEQTKNTMTSNLQFQVSRPPSPDEELRLKALWEKQQQLNQSVTPEPLPPASPASELESYSPPEVQFDEEYKDSGGNTYKVISLGKDLPIALRKNDGTAIIGKAAAEIVKNGSKVENQSTEKAPASQIVGGDAAEGVRAAGQAIIGGFEGLGEKVTEQDQQIARAEQAIGRKLSTAEMNVITHGGTVEELKDIVDHQLKQGAEKLYSHAQPLHLRAESDLKKALEYLAAKHISLSPENITALLTSGGASFQKANELGAKINFVLTLDKTQNGDFKPRVHLTIQSLPKKPDGSELSDAEKQALMQQISSASEASAKEGLSAEEQLAQLRKDVPELLEGKLPEELEKLLPDGFKRYAIGFNQTGGYGSIDQANKYIEEHGGIDMTQNDIINRFLFADQQTDKEEHNASTYALGYYGPNQGRFVAVFPVNEPDTSIYPSATIYENKAFLQTPDYPYPKDLTIEKTVADGRTIPAINKKYVVGFIDVRGKFHRNPTFMQ